MDYRNFFLTDNKSGKKTNEKYIIKNHIEIYEKINSFIKNNGLDINLNCCTICNGVNEKNPN